MDLPPQARYALSGIRKGVLFAQLATLVVALLILPFFSFHDMWDLHSKEALNTAYKALVPPGTRPQSFPSKAGVEQALAAKDPKLVVLDESPQAAYSYLRRQVGHQGAAYVAQGTVYVAEASPTHLALVGRYGSEQIVELDATITRSGPVVKEFHSLYQGHANWSNYFWTVFGFDLAFCFFGSLLGAAWGLDEETKRARWLAVVSDHRLGPKKPQLGYSVLWPYSEEQGGEVLLSTKRLVWTKVKDYERWQEDKGYDPSDEGGVPETRVKSDVGTPQLSGAWFDFCARVALVNSANWRRRQAQSQLKEILKGDPKATSEGAATAVLAPAGLLMAEALDSQTLPLEP